MKILPALLALLTTATLAAQPRIVRTINDNWQFSDGSTTCTVNLPHTWNAADTWDETPGFRRGEGIYTKTLHLTEDLTGKRSYIRFEGANQICTLTVNGHPAGTHKGGYTAFIFDVTDLLHTGDNELEVTVDNSFSPDIPPLAADFTFYGGIYRDVELIFTASSHICTTDRASSGVYISTPEVGSSSVARIRTLLDISAAGRYILRQQVFGPDGTEAASAQKMLKLAGGRQTVEMDVRVDGSRLWDIDDPQLYRVTTSLCNLHGTVLDAVDNPLGFRTFAFDPDSGFTLNGRHVKLIGTNRHQDYLERGNALADEMHVRDLQLLRDMGGNFLRISHYPQDPIMTQLCDRYGIVCSVEIPVINYISTSDAFAANCVEMAREMVCQNFNNPSVLIWAYMNEILLDYRSGVNGCRKMLEDAGAEGAGAKGAGADGSGAEGAGADGSGAEEASTVYNRMVTALAQSIDDAIKEIDPARPTMIPCHSYPKIYKDSGLGEVPDILGWNFYCGWYSAACDDFGLRELPLVRRLFPDKPFILSEYGAGIDPRLHSRAPCKFDFSAEYGLDFHRYYFGVIRDSACIAGSNAWNLNDFYSEYRVDAVPHVNNKGLVGLDRQPKDTYLYYKANLLRKPFLKIGGRTWKLRGGSEGDVSKINVFSNCSQVTLWLNSQLVGTSDVADGMATFEVCLADGENVLAAEGRFCGNVPAGDSGFCGSGKVLRDAISIDYAAVPDDMSRFEEMSVSLGSDCWFEDDVQGLCWIPEQEYRPGSWGYVGGSRMPASNAAVRGTINEPLYQTQRCGLSAFKADVPDGVYYVYLHFAEMRPADGKRVFDVLINGEKVLAEYDSTAEEGTFRAAIKKFTASVSGGRGLEISFSPSDSTTCPPSVAAIRLYRCL